MNYHARAAGRLSQGRKGLRGMAAYFNAIWKCRYFWLSLVKTDLRARYRGSVIGVSWSLVHPIAMTAIICVAFGTLLQQPWEKFAPFLMAGLTFWNYLGTVTVGGCQSFFAAESYIRQYPAPMAIYPLRTMLGGAFHYTLGVGLVLALGAITHGYNSPWPVLSLLPTLVLLLLLGWALAILFAVVNVRFRDTHHLSEIGMQILFYMTPVMYPPDLLQNHRKLGTLLLFNPLVPFLELLRKPLVESQVPDLSTYLIAAAIVGLTAVIATIVLRAQERQIIFQL
jgi:lipopolysaccharide transport system permease protein